MKPHARTAIVVAAMAAASSFLPVLTGCASSHRERAEAVIGPGDEPIGRVAVTPMIRATPAEVRPGVGPAVEKNVTLALKRKGIVASLPDPAGAAPSIEEEDLKEAAADQLRAIAPGSERFLLVIFLTDWSSRITFGSTCNAEVSGYLVDKQAGRVVWHAKGNGKAGQGGLLGMMMKRASDHDAIAAAVANLMVTFPKAVSRV